MLIQIYKPMKTTTMAAYTTIEMAGSGKARTKGTRSVTKYTRPMVLAPRASSGSTLSPVRRPLVVAYVHIAQPITNRANRFSP